jgi:tyrosyl-tRNA synthetase
MPEKDIFNKSVEPFWSEVADRRLGNEAYLEHLEGLLWQREAADLSRLTADQQYRLLTRRCYEEFPHATEDHPSLLQDRLAQSKRTGVPLNVKYGIDPTGRDIHWGHVLALRSASKMVRMGHNLNFIVGGFTAMVGDGTDKKAPRKPLSAEEVAANQASYFEQISPLIPQTGKGRINYYNNSQWLQERPLDQVTLMKLYQHVMATDLLKRRTFQERMSRNQPISMAELLYPIYTGYDSVAVEADVEVCGQDQFMNTLVARDVQAFFGQEQEAILATHLIPGTDGRGNKMSKSLGNYVGINEPPEIMFAKIMAMADDLTPLEKQGRAQPKAVRFGLIRMYLEQYTDIDDVEMAEIMGRLKKTRDGMDPLAVKKLIGRFLVGQIYGQQVALEAQQVFEENYALMQDRRAQFEQRLEQAGGIAGELSGIGFENFRGPGIHKIMGNSQVRLLSPDGQTISVIQGVDKYMVNNPNPSGTDRRKQIPLTEGEFFLWAAEQGININDLILQRGEEFFAIHLGDIEEI